MILSRQASKHNCSGSVLIFCSLCWYMVKTHNDNESKTHKIIHVPVWITPSVSDYSQEGFMYLYHIYVCICVCEREMERVRDRKFCSPSIHIICFSILLRLDTDHTGRTWFPSSWQQRCQATNQSPLCPVLRADWFPLSQPVVECPSFNLSAAVHVAHILYFSQCRLLCNLPLRCHACTDVMLSCFAGAGTSSLNVNME